MTEHEVLTSLVYCLETCMDQEADDELVKEVEVIAGGCCNSTSADFLLELKNGQKFVVTVKEVD